MIGKFRGILIASAVACAFVAASGAATAQVVPSPGSVTLSCSGGTSGTCSVSGQVGNFTRGAQAFHWEGKNISITPTSTTTANFACFANAPAQSGYITAATSVDPVDGLNTQSVSATVSILCK
ncbi:hypothetical protein LMG28688_03077 [Paraburkholderia caffeinitolerans]|uniref:Ig-like domain-containing protein n=1 Tax=Paraburkholderia caffeinitolerans TaxID=1723730 RepID=A0A6J5G2Y8_9BURK|nr:hypothetical protein LMG28688_03077 [Paraburkholderia caffeinitolerans]